ncbi:MAG: Rossmann-fold NAD(P)-binding domain-containing protein, partial [Planctomycetota bacterium]
KEIGWRLGPIIRTGVYNPGMDMNCGPDELRAIYAGAGLTIGKVTDTSFFTALSVENSIYACGEELGAKHRISIAISGFGRVAGHLAGRLPPKEYRIVAISTLSGAIRNRNGFDSRLLVEKRNELGDDVVKDLQGEKIDREEVLTEPVDILIPSSRTWVVTAALAENVKARMVVPIANVPYEDRAVARLHGKGVVCLPGCISNAGGVFGSSLYDTGVGTADIAMLVKTHYQPVVKELVRQSRALKLPPTEVAELLAAKELRSRKGRAENLSTAAKILKRLRRRVPRAVRVRAARGNFVQNMRSIVRDLENLATR